MQTNTSKTLAMEYTNFIDFSRGKQLLLRTQKSTITAREIQPFTELMIHNRPFPQPAECQKPENGATERRSCVKIPSATGT